MYKTDRRIGKSDRYLALSAKGKKTVREMKIELGEDVCKESGVSQC